MEKLEKATQKVCGILEWIIALLVLVGILFALFGFLRGGNVFSELLTDTDSFRQYLDEILLIVIGIEFLRMLCRPSSDNVIEVIIFLVARHMIVSNTTPYQDFVSVLSIILLCLVRQYLHRVGDDNGVRKK